MVNMAKHCAIGASGVFLLLGSVRFLRLQASERVFSLFLLFLLTWSYIGAFHLEDTLWVQVPIFGLIGMASMTTCWCFYRMRSRRYYLGAGLLAVGFLLWGAYLVSYPFLQLSEPMISAGFFISAVLQLFIAVSMIILVLEEVRASVQVAQDKIQEQRHQTERLRRKVSSTEERYRSLFDQATEAIIVTTADDFRVLELNQAARHLLGVELTDAGNQRLPDFCILKSEVARGSGAAWFEAVCKERQFNVVRRDGTVTPIEVDGAPISFEGIAAFQFFFRELTERTRLEQQLRQAEKLSALGQMISGIAHELNNPLAVIKGYLELILSRHELSHQTRTDLEKVAREGNRAAKLVNNFLSFAREQPVSRKAVDINELIQRVAELRQFECRNAGVQMIMDLAEDVPVTMADPDQLQQVLVNLINNSIQALATCRVRPPHLWITSRHANGMVEIAVEDNGPGIPDAVLPHVFEPFFTTKEVGKGTGLGLSIAHSIMADHKGKIIYESGRQGGARFLMELPVITPGTAKDEDVMPFQAEPSHSGERAEKAEILILDDERSLAELLGEMLELLGHSVSLCCSAEQALEVLSRRRFDLVLSDYRMPGMDGQQFYQVARERYSYLTNRIAFLTGDVVTEETQEFLGSIGTPHLSKPFQLSSVEQLVEWVLARNAILDDKSR